MPVSLILYMSNKEGSKKIKVVDRNNKVLGEFTVASSDTVESLKKMLIKDC